MREKQAPKRLLNLIIIHKKKDTGIKEEKKRNFFRIKI